ncbi:Bacillus transposase protein [Streptococcus gordonii]|uniref:EndoU domain-containing protein n=1 Tax=Streptococcus gordonii TaxID=1302 RepID=UPI0009BC9FBF|nr:EndoU domain-containing protein [Streptococcus gordonii]VTT11608.1 Bacillus transposase protein [Streptococcus gordonii]
MGVKYSATDSAQLIQAMGNNLQIANQVTDRLSSGCDHLVASLESGELQGAAYTAGKGLFTEIIIPAIKKLQEAIDDIQGELASYKSADSEVAGYGELDLDLLKEQLKIKNEQLEKVEKQIADNQDFFRNAGALLTGKLGDLLSQTSALMEVETQLNIGIREIQEKIDKLEWFVAQVSQYFSDSLQVLGLAIQGASQLSQILLDSDGNYSTEGLNMSWVEEIKKAKIQTISKSDYRTPQEHAIDKAVKDMKLSGAAEIYYRGKLAGKLKGKPRSEWEKIITNFNKDLKTEKGDNLLDVFDMSRAELEEKYGDKIQAYEHFLNTGYTDVSIATMSQDALKLIMTRYDQVKSDHLGLSPTELAKVDPAFKKKIDGMSQEEIEKEFPELKNAISQAHVNPYSGLFMSETERANRSYAIDRYFLMDSQKLLSWRDPNYTAKFNHYILEEGINPITLEPATAEEIQTAEWYNRIHPITETLSWGTALYSAYVGYNQYYNKPYTTIPEAFGKGKDWIKGKIPSMRTQPVVEVKTYTMDDLANLKHTENFTEKSKIHIFEGDLNRRGQSGGYHYDMVEGTSGNVIEGTKGPVLNDTGVYEAKVEVDGIPKKANGGYSTFFPDNMSPQEVVDAINEAYEERQFKVKTRNTYEGFSKNGMKITMYLDSDEKIISAFPSKE